MFWVLFPCLVLVCLGSSHVCVSSICCLCCCVLIVWVCPPLPFMSHDVFNSLFVPFSCSFPLCLVSSSCLHLSPGVSFHVSPICHVSLWKSHAPCSVCPVYFLLSCHCVKLPQLRMCFLFLCHPHVYSGSLCHSFSVRLSVKFMPCFQVSMFQVSTHPHQISCLGFFMSIFGFPILGYYLASSWFAFPHCFVVCHQP